MLAILAYRWLIIVFPERHPTQQTFKEDTPQPPPIHRIAILMASDNFRRLPISSRSPSSRPASQSAHSQGTLSSRQNSTPCP